MSKIFYEQKSWGEIKNKIEKHHPKLVEILDKNPSLVPNHVTEASVPYGLELLQDKDNKNVNVDSSLCLVLSGSIEHTFEIPEHVETIRIYKKGDLIIPTAMIDNNHGKYTPKQCFYMYSGVRSIFTPNIKLKDSKAIQRMCNQYGHEYSQSTTAKEQHQNFKIIARTHAKDWQTKVILLPPDWLDAINSEIQCYLYDDALKNSPMIDPVLLRLFFDKILHQNNITLSLGRKSILESIFKVITGQAYGFRPTQNESYAPINAIQSALIDVYKIKYIPLFFAPSKKVLVEESTPIYFFFLEKMQQFVDSVKFQSNLEMGAFFCKILERVKRHIKQHPPAQRDDFIDAFDSLNIKLINPKVLDSPPFENDKAMMDIKSKFSPLDFNISVYSSLAGAIQLIS